MSEYRIEFVLPVSSNGKYKIRLNSFKKHGFRNIDGVKVLVTLLIGTDNIPDILEGWPTSEFFHVRAISSTVNHHAAKVNDYYARYAELHDGINIDWWMRIDDDSFTNVRNLMDKLSEFYPDEDCHYFIGNIYEGDVSVDVKVAESMGINVKRPLLHEIECCILSKRLINRMFKNHKVLDFLKERGKVEAGYTDISLSIAAQMVGIYPTQVHFITKDANVWDFMSGFKHHIHSIAPDVEEFKYRFLTNHNTKKVEFCDQDLIFGVKTKGNLDFICNRRLQKNGLCFPYHEKFMWYYEFDTNTLLLLNGDFRIIDKYIIPNEENITYTEGIALGMDKVPFIRSLN